MPDQQPPLRIGVLALQGSFREHMSSLARIPGVQPVEVRTKEELASVAGLIIPGGESTTMALVAERWGLIPELQAFAHQRERPVWGTCAGLIFLANKATGMKEGGQALLGGLDCMVHRNFFGAQINSFETQLPAPACLRQQGEQQQQQEQEQQPGRQQPARANGSAAAAASQQQEQQAGAAAADETFRAVFIRAPAITEVGPGVEVLAEYQLTPEEREKAGGRGSVMVAVRSGRLMATAFHPELTQDTRWHRLFVDMARQAAAADDEAAAAAAAAADPFAKLGRAPNRPADLPVFHN